MTERCRAIELAEEHVESCIVEDGKEWFLTVEKERTGNGCGCNNCAKTAVRKVNEVIDQITEDEELRERYHYELVTERGHLKILAPDERGQWHRDHRDNRSYWERMRDGMV